MCDETEAVISLHAAGRRLLARGDLLFRLCEVHGVPVLIDDDGIRCLWTEHLPRLRELLAAHLDRPRLWPKRRPPGPSTGLHWGPR